MDAINILKNSFLSLTIKNTTTILLISLNRFIINKKNYLLNKSKIMKNKSILIIFFNIYNLKN